LLAALYAVIVNQEKVQVLLGQLVHTFVAGELYIHDDIQIDFPFPSPDHIRVPATRLALGTISTSSVTAPIGAAAVVHLQVGVGDSLDLRAAAMLLGIKYVSKPAYISKITDGVSRNISAGLQCGGQRVRSNVEVCNFHSGSNEAI
jgi:hypothetical protein